VQGRKNSHTHRTELTGSGQPGYILPTPENTPTPYESTFSPISAEAAAAIAAEMTARARAEMTARARAEMKAREEAEAKANAATSPDSMEAVPTQAGEASLASTNIAVQRNGTALVKLHCAGSGGCEVKLTLTARIASEAKDEKGRTRTVTIGAEKLSIAAGKTSIAKIDLNSRGRSMLKADHGHLPAKLAIFELSTQETLSKDVRLIAQTIHSAPIDRTPSKGTGAIFAIGV
jgi:hypothetical protein